RPEPNPGSTSRLPTLPGPGAPPLIEPMSLCSRVVVPVVPICRSPAGLFQRMLLDSVNAEPPNTQRPAQSAPGTLVLLAMIVLLTIHASPMPACTTRPAPSGALLPATMLL